MAQAENRQNADGDESAGSTKAAPEGGLCLVTTILPARITFD